MQTQQINVLSFIHKRVRVPSEDCASAFGSEVFDIIDNFIKEKLVEKLAYKTKLSLYHTVYRNYLYSLTPTGLDMYNIITSSYDVELPFTD